MTETQYEAKIDKLTAKRRDEKKKKKKDNTYRKAFYLFCTQNTL